MWSANGGRARQPGARRAHSRVQLHGRDSQQQFVVVPERWRVGGNAVVRFPADHGNVAQLGYGHPCAGYRMNGMSGNRG